MVQNGYVLTHSLKSGQQASWALPFQGKLCSLQWLLAAVFSRCHPGLLLRSQQGSVVVHYASWRFCLSVVILAHAVVVGSVEPPLEFLALVLAITDLYASLALCPACVITCSVLINLLSSQFPISHCAWLFDHWISSHCQVVLPELYSSLWLQPLACLWLVCQRPQSCPWQISMLACSKLI